MKTYTFAHGLLTEGLSVSTDEKFGPHIFLGESGRGRRWEKVSICRKNPADVMDGRVKNAHPVKITVNKGTEKERAFFVLAKSETSGNRILVRINTQAVYTRNTAGWWKTHKGAPVELMKGFGAHGIAGRIGNWDDGLLILSPGDVLYIKLEGGYKNEPYALVYPTEGEFTVMKWADYERESAAKADDAEYKPL